MRKNERLGEQQEILLCRHFDGECDWFSSFRAKRLLRKSKAAQDFFTTLQNISSETKFFGDQLLQDAAQGACCRGLWDRVSARIESEEKAEIFLGKRTVISEQSFFSLPRVVWGMSGAAAALCLVAVVSLDGRVPGSQSEPTFESSVASLQDPRRTSSEEENRSLVFNTPLSPVQSVSTGPASLEQAYQPQARRFVEVDWMKSDGSVRVLHDPTASAPIIIVKKRPLDSIYQSRRTNARTVYRSRSRVPTATLVSE